MKYSVIALFALSLFSLASCQNTASNSSTQSEAESQSGGESESALELSPTNVLTEAPAAEPNKLSEQILTDFLEAKKASTKYAPANDENFQMIKTMKVSWGSQGDAEKARIEKLVKEAMMFYEVYQKHEQCIAALDSLSSKVMAGSIVLEDAQKEYVRLREQLKSSGGRLQSGEAKMKAVKSEWEREFPDLSKKPVE
jgi:hypothetical protein